jgi:redox-regulated HSP33 family molecular chaperone
MSCELISTHTTACLCGKGKLIEEVYSDDWNRINPQRSIQCEHCNSKYHFETQYIQHGDKSFEQVYMVENGKSISIKYSTHDFHQDVACHYTYAELQGIRDLLSATTSCNKLKGSFADFIIKAHKARYNSIKISMTRQHVDESIEKYYTNKFNKETILTLQAECERAKGNPIYFT